MRRTIVLIRRLTGHGTVWLAGAVIVIAGAGIAASAKPAWAAAHGRAMADALPAPTPIKVNRTNWSGKAGFGSRGPAWFKDRSGVVHIEGALTQVNGSGKGANTLGTLPRAARPFRDVFTIVHTYNGTFADLEIARNGRLNLIDPRSPAVKDYFFVSLEGISYRLSGKVTLIPLVQQEWEPAGSGARAPAWYKDRSGFVHLQGAFAPADTRCSGVCVVGVLPRPARPQRVIFAIVHTFNGTYGELEILPGGDLFVVAPPPPLVSDFFFVSLEGVTYRPAGPVNLINLNSMNWTTLADPARIPAWFTDRSGIVNLQGAVLQRNNMGSGANLIGILPPAARPAHNVFTIVVTNVGAYADLEIARNGQVNVINPRSPAVNGNALVSLDGISYRR